MQHTTELEHGRESTWFKPAAICALGIVAAAAGGAAAGWLDWRLNGGRLGISLLNLMVLPVICVPAIALALTRARIRSRWVGLAVALLIVLAFQAASEVAAYGLMRQDMMGVIRRTAQERGLTATEAQYNQAIDKYIEGEFGVPGIAGFAVGRYQTDAPLLAIRLLVGLLCAWLTWSTVYNRPYCAACGDWYGRPVFTGALPYEEYDTFFRLIATGDLTGAGQMLRKDLSGYPRVMVYTVTCKNSEVHDSLLIANLYQIPAGTSSPQHSGLMTLALKPGQLGELRFGLGVPGPAEASPA